MNKAMIDFIGDERNYLNNHIIIWFCLLNECSLMNHEFGTSDVPCTTRFSLILVVT